MIWTTRNRAWEFAILRFWSKGMARAVGLDIEVRGMENLPARPCLFVFNHQSLLDIPVIHAAIPRDFRFGAKSELFKIPIFGKTMTDMRVLPIARGQRDEAVRVLEQAALRIQNGESFILAPEGTRQKEPKIGEFKSGPFMLAMRARAPMVPLVLTGMSEVMPKKAFLIHSHAWKSRILVEILPPIEGADYDVEGRNAFKDKVRMAMTEAYAGKR